jgi:hypothetical protein
LREGGSGSYGDCGMDQKQPEGEMVGVVGVRLEGNHSGKGKERERGKSEWKGRGRE